MLNIDNDDSKRKGGGIPAHTLSEGTEEPVVP